MIKNTNYDLDCCPFCGGDATIYEEFAAMSHGGIYYFVGCCSCGVIGRKLLVDSRIPDLNINAKIKHIVDNWNKREVL